MALERSHHHLSMRYDADRRRWRLVFRKRTLRRGALVPDESLLRTTASAAAAAAAADALDRVAGMIKKAVDRSSGRRVRGEGDKIPAIGTVAPDLPLEKLRNTNILSIRGLHPLVHRRTPCAFAPQVPILRPRRCASSSAATSARPACSTELASTCRPLPAPARSPAHSRMAWNRKLLKPIRMPGAALLACSRLVQHTA